MPSQNDIDEAMDLIETGFGCFFLIVGVIGVCVLLYGVTILILS